MNTPNATPKSWREKFNGLGMMVGWNSIRKGMGKEDHLRDAHMATQHNLRNGGKPILIEPGTDGDDVGDNIVLGDMTVTHEAPPAKNGMGGLAKTLVGAGLLASGVGIGGLVANHFLGGTAEKVVENIITQPGKTVTKTNDVDVKVQYIPPKE